MLLEFSCSNHKSIREEVCLSLFASDDRSYPEQTLEVAGVRVLKSAVIYGPNGSGKSKIIDAIQYAQARVLISDSKFQRLHQVPHHLDGMQKESTYRIEFVTKGMRYALRFSIKDDYVKEESLYYFPEGNPTSIYERHDHSCTPGEEFAERFSIKHEDVDSYSLVLAQTKNMQNVPQEIRDAYSFFEEELIVSSPEDYIVGVDARGNNFAGRYLTSALDKMNRSKELKDEVLRFLRDLGTGISDIEFNPYQLRGTTQFKAKIVYGEGSEALKTSLNVDESSGVVKLVCLLCSLLDTMKNGKVFVCDEMDANLHESLLYSLVEMFLTTKTEKFPQMVFTIHSTCILGLDWRRDQIWFTEMRKDERSTDLYSLLEFNDVEDGESVEQGYIAGKYGAIPMLNLKYANIVYGQKVGC